MQEVGMQAGRGTFYKEIPQLLLQADGVWYKQTDIMFHSLQLITHPHSS